MSEAIPTEAAITAAWVEAGHPDVTRDVVRRMLEAAAPHMLAEAWDDGSNSGYLWALKEGPWQEPDETAPTNPYKTETL